MSKLKIGIFGAGAIGCYIGGRLLSAGFPVIFVGRERLRREIEDKGLRLSHYNKSELYISPENIDYRTSPQSLESCAVIFVTVKSPATAQAAAELARCIPKTSVVISLQNGVGNADILRAALPENLVLGAMIPNNVVGLGDGKFHLGTEGTLIIEASAQTKALVQALRESGVDAAAHDDILAVQWGKLILNLSNAINTLSGKTYFAQMRERGYRLAMAMSVEETLCVLAAAGQEAARIGKVDPARLPRLLRLPDFAYRLLMRFLIKIDRTARSSMAQDLAAKRPISEIEALNGAVIALGERAGVQTPVNRYIRDEILRAFEAGQSPHLGAKALLAGIRAARRE